jgi:transcriptional regulator with XRE-family HTH domain
MQEQELRAVLAENIKKYRNRRGWSQLILSEKLDLSSNFLSEIETGKGWVSPLTLTKLATALEIEVYELFKPIAAENTAKGKPEAEKMRRFAKDLSEALDVSVAETAKDLRKTVAKVCKEYLG